MTSPIGPAQHWAQQQTPARAIRWKSLEVAAFASHPRVVRALGPTREEKREARQNPKVRWWIFLALPLLLVATLVLFYPAAAFLLLADGRTGRFDVDGIDAALAIPLAGVVLLVGGGAHVFSIARRRERGAFDSALDTAAVLFGAATSLSIAGRGRRDDVSAWPWWLVVALLVIAVGVSGLVRGRSLPAPTRVVNGTPRAGARRAVARLPGPARQAIERDIEAAIGDLERRGLVTPTMAERARAADLAMLSIAVNG